MVQFDLDLRVDVAEPVLRGFQFAAADVLCSVKNLALQVGKIHLIEIDNPDCSDAGCCEIKRGRRPESAGANAQNASCLQPALPLGRNFRHDKMTRVALQFRSTQMCRGAPFIIDDASLHAVRFILAQKDGAVAGDRRSRLARARVQHGRHRPESFRGYNFHCAGFTLLPSPASLRERFRKTV